MKRLGVAAALLVLGSTAQAQGGSVSTSCAAAATELRDACQKANDIFRYLAPQLGTTIAGGNTVLGSGGVLGGLPHWTIGLRATLIAGSIPKFTAANAPSTSGATASVYNTDDTPIAFPALDGAIGIFGGIPLGLTKIGGIDLLANAAYVPTVKSLANISIEPQSNLEIGYGVRVGLLQESLLVPGVSVSMIRRGLPTTTITSFTTAGSSGTDTLQIKDLDLKTTSYRLTVSKSLILFGVAAGIGMDKYSSSTDVNVVIRRPNPILPATSLTFRNATPFSLESDMTRTNMFLDGYVNILLIKIVGELGMVRGGDLTTFNTFPDKLPTASRAYGAFGIRVGF